MDHLRNNSMANDRAAAHKSVDRSFPDQEGAPPAPEFEHGARGYWMVTRAARLEEFFTDVDPEPGTLVELLCEDHVGTYLLPYLCKRTDEGFRNERTGDLIEVQAIGWRIPKSA